MIDWTKEQVRKTATQMVADNPLLTDGQLAVESDTRRCKVGPGYFNALGYDASVDMGKADAAWETDQRDGRTDGAGSISIGGEAWKVYGIEATSDEQGSVILDLEGLLPGITHVKMASVANNSSTEAKIVLGGADPVSPLSAYAITVYDEEFNALTDAPVLITLYVKGT